MVASTSLSLVVKQRLLEVILHCHCMCLIDLLDCFSSLYSIKLLVYITFGIILVTSLPFQENNFRQVTIFRMVHCSL